MAGRIELFLFELQAKHADMLKVITRLLPSSLKASKSRQPITPLKHKMSTFPPHTEPHKQKSSFINPPLGPLLAIVSQIKPIPRPIRKLNLINTLIRNPIRVRNRKSQTPTIHWRRTSLRINSRSLRTLQRRRPKDPRVWRRIRIGWSSSRKRNRISVDVDSGASRAE